MGVYSYCIKNAFYAIEEFKDDARPAGSLIPIIYYNHISQFKRVKTFRC
jgi:hypothetical protein